MIFWIILALVAVTTIIITAYWTNMDRFSTGLYLGFMTLVVGGTAGIIIMLIISIWFGPTWQPKGESDHTLVALQTDSSIQGRSYFLSGGYVNDVRVLNYITEDDGAYRLSEAIAADAIIYQDSADATVTIHELDMENPWFAPWTFGHTHTYEFHVPEGSILSDYTVTND